MQTIILQIPDFLNVKTFDLKMKLCSQLYSEGTLSLGQAAVMAGLSKRAFAELLGHYNVSIFNYSASDLEKDIANA